LCINFITQFILIILYIFNSSIGTGKTATFSISILQQIDTSIKECQALILAPTRELAQQVSVSLGKRLLRQSNHFLLRENVNIMFF